MLSIEMLGVEEDHLQETIRLVLQHDPIFETFEQAVFGV